MMLVKAPGVPDYEVVFSEPKTSDYSLVIPVINEGERIEKLLSTMQAKGIMAEEKVDELKEKSKQMVVM